MAGEFRGGGGVSKGAFEAASPGQSKELGQSKRLEQITALRFNYSPPDTTSPLFVFTALAYHRTPLPPPPPGKSNMEAYQAPPPPTFLSFSLSRSLSVTQEKWIV